MKIIISVYLYITILILSTPSVFAETITTRISKYSLAVNLVMGSYAEKNSDVYTILGNIEAVSLRGSINLKEISHLALLLDSGIIVGDYLGINMINSGKIEHQQFRRIPIILKFCNHEHNVIISLGLGIECLWLGSQYGDMNTLIGWMLGFDIPIGDNQRTFYIEYKKMDTQFRSQREYSFIEFTIGLKTPFLSN